MSGWMNGLAEAAAVLLLSYSPGSESEWEGSDRSGRDRITAVQHIQKHCVDVSDTMMEEENSDVSFWLKPEDAVGFSFRRRNTTLTDD